MKKTLFTILTGALLITSISAEATWARGPSGLVTEVYTSGIVIDKSLVAHDEGYVIATVNGVSVFYAGNNPGGIATLLSNAMHSGSTVRINVDRNHLTQINSVRVNK